MIRKLVRLRLQLGVNRHAVQFGSKILSGELIPLEIGGQRGVYRPDQLADTPDGLVRPLPLDATSAEWWSTRVESFERECKRMSKSEVRLAAQAAELGESCTLWTNQSCHCSLCALDGSVTAFIGLFKTHGILARARYTEVYVHHMATPRRGPIIYEHAAEGGLLPVDNGQRRKAALRAIEGLLAGGIPQAKRGRPIGSGGIDWRHVVEKVDHLNDAGYTKASVFKDIADETGYPVETIDRGYRRQRHRS